MRVTKMTTHVGAEVTDIDLARGLPDSEIASLRAALLEHRVLFFSDQDLDHASHIEFARRFGPVTAAHPLIDTSESAFPEILTVDNLANERKYGKSAAERRRTQTSPLSSWHSDLTPVVNPPSIGILRAQTVPAFGGDTQWCNLVAAYQGISPAVRAMLETLAAEHRYLAGYQSAEPDDRYHRTVAARPLAAVHPVVRRHPETGESALFVNPLFTHRILGLTGAESRHVLAMLFEQLTDPAFTVRYRWRAGSVAMWDNRATAHTPPADLAGPVERVLHRVSVVGEVPVGVGGQRSYALDGDPWRAHRHGDAAG